MFNDKEAVALGIKYEALCLQLANLKKLDSSVPGRDEIIANHQKGVDDFWYNIYLVH